MPRTAWFRRICLLMIPCSLRNTHKFSNQKVTSHPGHCYGTKIPTSWKTYMYVYRGQTLENWQQAANGRHSRRGGNDSHIFLFDCSVIFQGITSFSNQLTSDIKEMHSLWKSYHLRKILPSSGQHSRFIFWLNWGLSQGPKFSWCQLLIRFHRQSLTFLIHEPS